MMKAKLNRDLITDVEQHLRDSGVIAWSWRQTSKGHRMLTWVGAGGASLHLLIGASRDWRSERNVMTRLRRMTR